jgi:hypothetical protein
LKNTEAAGFDSDESQSEHTSDAQCFALCSDSKDEKNNQREGEETGREVSAA